MNKFLMVVMLLGLGAFGLYQYERTQVSVSIETKDIQSPSVQGDHFKAKVDTQNGKK